MNSLRKLAVWTVAVVLVALSMPSTAAPSNTKYFWVAFDQIVGVKDGANVVRVVFNNATPPPGVSTINSGRIRVISPPGITITGVKLVAQNGVPSSIVVPFSDYPLATTPSGTDIVITNFPGIKNNQNATFELTLAGTLPACSSITWAAYANTGNAYPQGDEFKQSTTTASQLQTGIACGNLACQDTAGTLTNTSDLYTYVKASNQGKWNLVRGNNKPITTASCQEVPYIFDLNVSTTPQVSKFIVPNPSVSGQAVAVKYTVVWGRFDANVPLDNMFTSKRPNFSWGIANPVVRTADYVPALPCVLDPDNPDLASTYPNGFASVPSTDLDKLLPVIPNEEPFKSSPYAQYQPGQKAKMCITQQGWTAVGTDSLVSPLTVSLPNNPIMFQLWSSVIDQADGFMNVE